jgi:hypothetical protein
MFPEDFQIDKDRLIKMWMAEGFIQCEKQGKSLFELGESYFNDLINRSLIQPIYSSYNDVIYYCRIHDMVLDLIRFLSSEENFVTIINGDLDRTSPSNAIRRLSLHNVQESHVMAHATWSLQHTRSIVIFPAAVSKVPTVGCCRVLRVLDLEGCNLSQTNNIQKCIGNLHHLRYLGLRGTCISQLPEEIENLQFLQTLDVSVNKISSLPSSVVQLRMLVHLYIDEYTSVSKGIGNLTNLEQLTLLYIDDSNIDIIEELGQLTELRQLCIQLEEWYEKLLEYICKLQKMQDLTIMIKTGERSIGGLDAFVAPQHIRELYTQYSCWFSKLPAWVNPSLVPDVTCLVIAVRELHQVDLEILGGLPALQYLSLEVDSRKNLCIHQGFVVGADSFPCIVRCYLKQFVWPVVFRQRAMPRLRNLGFFPFYLREGRGTNNRNDVGVDMGLGNLTSLQEVRAYLQCEGASLEEAEQAKAALTHAAEIHPNRPSHDITILS